MGPTRVLRLDTTQSTNADAARLAQGGERGPLWIVAGEQTSGRGRRGRVWQSPPGNLYASLLLTDACAAEHAAQLGFVAGVALIDAVEGLVGADAGFQLKWPNDLLYDRAKLTGILLEGSRTPDGVFISVVGIGVNCTLHPVGMAYPTTDLSAVAGRAIAPDDLLPHLDAAMTRWLARWNRGTNFSAVREAWLARAAGLGLPIEVTLHDGVTRGVFDTIDATGRLVLVTDHCQLFVDAGDIRITPAVPSAAFA